MKLYRYTFHTYNTKVDLEELDVEEKAKTYTILNVGWKQRIDKEDVGRTSGYGNDIVILTEKDFEKARAIYLAHLQKKIIEKKESLESMEKYYKDICDMEAI